MTSLPAAGKSPYTLTPNSQPQTPPRSHLRRWLGEGERPLESLQHLGAHHVPPFPQPEDRYGQDVG
jgi:hypothetical protein